MDGIKKSIFYKKQEGYIITKKIFNFVNKYSRGMYYKNYINTLKYLKQYIKDENLDNLLNEFEEKNKIKKISAKVFNEDVKRIASLIELFDPRQIPPATGKLRDIQQKELALLKEVMDDIYKNTDLKPFMDDGTLLGAVRHGGFIPWDDDVDFSLMRKDYIKLENYFKKRYIYTNTDDWDFNSFVDRLHEILDKYPNQFFSLKRDTSLKVFRGTAKEYYNVDFFALDYYNDDHNLITLTKYVKEIKKKFKKELTFSEKFKMFEEEIAKKQDIVEESNVIQAGIDNCDFYYYKMQGIRRPSDIFPLRKLKFEDTEFYAPNNPHEYLKTIYGYYKKLPLNIKIAKHTEDISAEELF